MERHHPDRNSESCECFDPVPLGSDLQLHRRAATFEYPHKDLVGAGCDGSKTC